MGNLFKQFGEWVTRWELKLQRDEFFVTRIRLTALYTILSVVFLIAVSYVLHWGFVSRLSISAEETIGDPNVRAIVLQKAEGIISDLIFIGDIIILMTVIIVGFFLTKKTLEPIRTMVKRQERFIADASHELRTPLTVIKTGIEVALRRKELSQSDARAELAGILEEVNILTTLSNDLLSISKDNSLSTKFINIFLPNLLEKTVTRLQPIAKEKNIQISLSGFADKDKYVKGNESMLGRVFYNLIHNAIAYTPENGSVTVDYSTKHNKYLVHITDTGIGISKESLFHIFEPFYRADNARTTHGSGLGLPIVKSSIDLHLGSISVKSKEGEGTTVTVELPIA